MEILDLKILRGPNYWSGIHSQLIDMIVRMPDEQPTTNTSELLEKLTAVFSQLDNNGDFLQKMQSVSVQEIAGQMAIELQLMAGIDTSFIKVETLDRNNTAHIVFSYDIKQAGIYAGTTAVKIVNTLLSDEPYTELQKDINELVHLKSKSIGPTTGYLLNEIINRHIPFKRFNESSLLILGYGVKQKKMRTAVTDSTSGLGMELASDKEETKQLLAEAHVPVPRGVLVDSVEELKARINEVKFPLVVKPLNGNHGRGVTTDINNMEDAIFGFDLANQISSTVILEEFIKGDDYRFLVVDYKLVAATKRSPAAVVGDGTLTIQELINKENLNPQRGKGAGFVLAIINVDKVTTKILEDKKLTLDAVLSKGEILVIKETANISSGGIATDVTDIVHPDNVFLVERVARMFNLDICGIDIMATAVDVPLTRDIGGIIEVNAGPGLRMHSNPQKGTPRNVAAKIADMLFPNVDSALIPIIAVADFPEAVTLTRLIACLAKHAGFKTGYNTSEGIFIQEHMSAEGNCIHFEDMQEVLFDPTVDFAVLQCADESILETGLPFKDCTISIIAGTSEKKSDTDSHEISEKRMKKVLMDSTAEGGYVILNADNQGLDKLIEETLCNVALFSTDVNNENIQRHCKNGGVAAVVENGTVLILEGGKRIPLVEMKSITDSIASYILPGVLTAVLRNFRFEKIQEGLASFVADASEELDTNLLSIINSENFV